MSRCEPDSSFPKEDKAIQNGRKAMPQAACAVGTALNGAQGWCQGVYIKTIARHISRLIKSSRQNTKLEQESVAYMLDAAQFAEQSTW